MRTINIAMIVARVRAVVFAVVVPGFQIALVVLGAALTGRGSYGLLGHD